MFFGWYIVAATMIIAAYQGGAISYGFTAFIAPIAATYGWSYAQISLGLSFRGLEVGAMDPFVGMAVDRWPARRLVLIGIILYGLGLVCISQAINLAMFYLGFLILGLGNSLSIHVVPQTLIARWFRKDLGKASAVLAMGSAVGGVLVPFLVKMIDAYGWQTSLIILAVGIWVMGIPFSFLFRSRPEEYSLLPDGKAQEDTRALSSLKSYDSGLEVGEVLKTRVFWQFGIAYMLHMGSLHAVLTHVMPYLDSLGVNRSTASIVAMLIPLVSLIGRLPFGLLSDIYPKKYVMSLSFGLVCVGLFLFWLFDGSSIVLIGAFVVIFSLGLSGQSPVRTPLIREYFGIKRFGTIYGMVGLFNMVGLLVYPPVAGWVYDTLGTYKPMWLVSGIGSAVALILMVTAPPPRVPDRLSK